MNVFKWIVIIFLFVNADVKAQIISTIAGNGSNISSGDGASALSAGVSYPASGCFDNLGNYYFGENSSSPRIRTITTTGLIKKIAGTGVSGFSGDGGPATNAKISWTSIKVDAARNIYIADYYNNRLRKVDAATGIINTVAGNGIYSSTGDGGPASASTIIPMDLCIDDVGNIYINDLGYIRKINVSGTITTFAGTGTLGFAGDGGPAIAADITAAYGICLDAVGNLYILCNSGTRVRKINISTGIITSIGGTGLAAYNGDEIPATSAQFKGFDIKVDNSGNIYIADDFNSRIRQIDISGIIHTVAGSGTSGYAGDGGTATTAAIDHPEGLAIDDCGNIYIADHFNNRIRKVNFNPHTTASAIISSVSTAPIGAVVTVTATVSGAGSAYNIKWFNRGTLFATTTVPTVTYTKATGTDTITARVVPAMAACYDSSTSAQHIVAVGTNGINDITAGDIVAISIYPNPAHSSLIVSADAVASSIVLTDLAGRVLLTKANNTTTAMLDISQLAAGVYFVKVNGLYVQKLIKE